MRDIINNINGIDGVSRVLHARICHETEELLIRMMVELNFGTYAEQVEEEIFSMQDQWLPVACVLEIEFFMPSTMVARFGAGA